MENCPRISAGDSSMSEAHFELHEVLESIKACAGDKAPGPMASPWNFSRSIGTLLI